MLYLQQGGAQTEVSNNVSQHIPGYSDNKWHDHCKKTLSIKNTRINFTIVLLHAIKSCASNLMQRGLIPAQFLIFEDLSKYVSAGVATLTSFSTLQKHANHQNIILSPHDKTILNHNFETRQEHHPFTLSNLHTFAFSFWAAIAPVCTEILKPRGQKDSHSKLQLGKYCKIL